MDLKELFSAKSLAANWTEAASNRIPYLGEGLFPAKKKAGLDLSWIKGHKGVPVSLRPSAFDAKPRYRDRIGVAKLETEMPFFRDSFKIKEKDRQDLLRATDTSDPYAQSVISSVYDDTRSLIDGALVVPERMVHQLIAPVDGTPKIEIAENGVNYSYNYDPDGSWKNSNFMELVTNKWNDADSCDPFDDLRTLADNIAENSGTRPGIALMRRSTLRYLRTSKAVTSYILAQNLTANIFMTDEIVQKAVSDYIGVKIIVYDKLYRDSSGVTKHFYPDNMVTLLPNMTIGNMYYGTTPEEAEHLFSAQEDVAIVNEGIAITKLVKNEIPVTLDIVASEIVLPSYENMDCVGAIKVV